MTNGGIFEEIERSWKEAVPSDPGQWAAEACGRLSRRQRWAQLLHPIYRGEDSAWDDVQPGGIFLPHCSWREARAHFLRWADRFEVPPILSGDHECRVDFREGVSVGSAMNLAAVAGMERACALARETGRLCAAQARAAGVAWTFAPVADVNVNPDNPITNFRSFGDDPNRVGELATAFLRGAQELGLAATLKHFPGDGLDNRDQHVTTPVNPLGLEAWWGTSGRPFQAGIDAGTWSVMIGHIACPAMERDPSHLGRPATLSPAILQFLRRELGFEGVIVTDALGMGGLQWHASSEVDSVVGCLEAGADMILFPPDLEASLDAIEAAVRSGRLEPAALEESVRRVLLLKARVGLAVGSRGFPDFGEAAFEAARRSGLAEAVARESVTVCRGELPPAVGPGDRVLVVELPLEEPDPGGLEVVGQVRPAGDQRFADALRRRGIDAHVITDPAVFSELSQGAAAAVYRFHSRPQAGRGSIRLAYRAMQMIELTREPRGLSRIYLSSGSPYVANELPLPHLLCGFSDVDAVTEACADVICGRTRAVGRCPVRLT